MPQWRAASLQRGQIGSLVIRCPTLPHPKDNSRPLECQRSHCCLVILAPHALLAIKSFRPPGVLERLPGKLVERLAEKRGAKPPEVRHGHVATALDDRGNTGEGKPVLNVFIPTPIRAQRTDAARGMCSSLRTVRDGLANRSISQLTIITNMEGFWLTIIANGPTMHCE